MKAKATPAKKAMVKAKPLRRPTSAYALFKKDMRQALRKLRKTDKLKLITVLWRGVSIEDKQVYEARALKLQQRFAIRARSAEVENTNLQAQVARQCEKALLSQVSRCRTGGMGCCLRPGQNIFSCEGRGVEEGVSSTDVQVVEG